MNAASQTFAYGDENARGLAGVVAAVSAVRTLIAMPADRARAAGVTVGTYLEVEGNPRAIAVIRGVETPAADADADAFELVIAEAELVGRLDEDGLPQRQPGCPSVGARATLLDIEAALGEWQSGFVAPLPLGRATDDLSLHLDGQRLLREGLSILGDSDEETAPTLAVIVRALLRQSFPARLVFIDKDDLFTESFGRAASVVDVSRALLPAGLLTAEEMRACLEAFGDTLTGEEWRILRTAAGAEDRSLGQLIATLEHERGQAGAGADDAHASLIRRLRDARDDERLALFFGEDAGELTPEAVLQRIFRLPDGRPPMAVCQLGGLEEVLKPVAADVILRLSRTLAEQARGRVPVLLAVQGAETLFRAGADLKPEPGQFAVLRAGTVSAGSKLSILHRHGATIADHGDGEGARADLSRECSRLEFGEALLVDSKLPWPQRFTVDALPDKAVPQRASLRAAPEQADIHTLLHSVLDAFASPAR